MEMSETNFSLEVQNRDFTRALKHLCRYEKAAPEVRLHYEDDSLFISLGRTSMDIPASGSWPGTVFVTATWAKAFATTPFSVPIIWLRVIDGKLHTRDHIVSCVVRFERAETDVVPDSRNKKAKRNQPDSRKSANR